MIFFLIIISAKLAFYTYVTVLFDKLFLKDFIYLFTRTHRGEKEREAETQAEGEAGSMQGA